MKKACLAFALLLLAASFLTVAAADDAEYENCSIVSVQLRNSCSVARVGETVTTWVEIEGGERPFSIVYSLSREYPVSAGSGPIGATGGDPVEDYSVSSEGLAENYVKDKIYYQPTRKQSFTFVPLRSGIFWVGAYITDADGHYFHVWGNKVLVVTEQDLASPDSLYSLSQAALGEAVHDGMTDREKAIAIHDWIIIHCEYATENGLPGMLEEHKGVCNGYALLYAYLCDLAGLRNFHIFSESMAHAWNAVWIDGEWLHVDCTWDDTGDTAGPQNRTYLLLTAEEMASSHSWETYPTNMAVRMPGQGD